MRNLWCLLPDGHVPVTYWCRHPEGGWWLNDGQVYGANGKVGRWYPDAPACQTQEPNA